MITTPSTLMVLGTSAPLAAYELTTVFGRYSSTPLNISQTLAIQDGQVAAEDLCKLGGTIKAAQVIGTTTLETAPELIAKHIPQGQKQKVALSSFSVGEHDLKRIGSSIRRHSKTKINFRILKSPRTSAGIKSKYTEYILFTDQGQLYIARTYWVQDIDDWSTKDYKRPASDPKSGMLPPKVARMMLNSAFPKKLKGTEIVYDPMCGSGTILMEAVDMGISSIGSDIHQQKVDQSIKNTQWLNKLRNTTVPVSVFKKDITQITTNEFPTKVDAIVFEGYLGPPNMTTNKLKNVHKGMTKLYIGALKKIHPLLKPKHRVVAALPEFHLGESVKSLDSMIDSCEKYGYTSLHTLTYGRPQAQIKRKIYILEAI